MVLETDFKTATAQGAPIRRRAVAKIRAAKFIRILTMGAFGEITTAVSALHKCRDFAFSTLRAAHRLAFDGDFGVSDRDHAEQQGAADTADRGAQGHEGEEHQHAAIAFKS